MKTWKIKRSTETDLGVLVLEAKLEIGKQRLAKIRILSIADKLVCDSAKHI